jgi:signal transduction histidine kinase
MARGAGALSTVRAGRSRLAGVAAPSAGRGPRGGSLGATKDARALSALARALSRALDGGLVSLASASASALVGAALVVAELLGLGGLCVTRADEAFFVAATAWATACLALCHALRGRRELAWPLAGGLAASLALSLYFPVGQATWLSFAMYAALPLSLYLPPPRGLAATALSLAALLALRLGVLPPEALGQRSASFREALACVVLPLAASLLAQGLAAFRAEADRLADALGAVTRLNLSYQDYSASVEEKSALEERLRLTRDIHDVVGYALTNTIMTMRAASLMCRREPERVPAFLDAARSDAERAHAQVRGILHDLRRREIRRAAGPVAIARTVRGFKAATGAEVDLDFGNFDWSISGEAAFAASHFVQEGMLNAVSHGKAGSIRVAFREEGGELLVSVKDDGSGAQELREGIGIAGMRERIERLGGSLSYGSPPGARGFAIEMRIPLEAPPPGQPPEPGASP